MRTHIFGLSVTVLLFLAACNPAGTPTSSPASAPSSTPEQLLPGPSAILLEENFESEIANNAYQFRGEWTITPDENDNSIFCNAAAADWSSFGFGTTTWTDYAVQMHVKFITDIPVPNQSVEIYSRINTNYEGYRFSLGIQWVGSGWGGIGFYPPSRSLAEFSMPIQANTWYVLRIETYRSHIRYYVDDELKAEADDRQRLEGMAGIGVTPNTLACIDDIRAWALTETGAIGLAPVPLHPDLEVVTDQAVVGDGGNQWGGHQTRIVHTQDGIFTAYTVDGSGDFAREWHLAWRQEDGSWLIAATGDAGKDPVNLLASPDGTLHIIGWPNQTGTMWSGKPENGQLTLTAETIPNMAYGNWPYGSAGIDSEGDLCVLSSIGGDNPGGEFRLACFLPSQGHWVTQTVSLDYRYCYTYVFPSPDGQLSLVSNRDVLWGVLGYTRPEDVFAYAFNAVGVWHSEDFATDPMQRVLFMEEIPSKFFPYVLLNAQEDVYQDTAGNLHILYRIQGGSTQGKYVNRHAIVSPSGEVLADVELHEGLGGYSRIFQNTAGRFYILGSSGVLYPAGMDGVTLGPPIYIDLQGYLVDYSGFGISAPRTGTLLSNVVDVVYPSGDGKQWIYFQITLPDE